MANSEGTFLQKDRINNEKRQNEDFEEWRDETTSRKERKGTNCCIHWGPAEQKKYVRFLVNKKELFEMGVQERKKAGIPRKMSKVIKGRNPSQCRSHHQKMLVKYGSIDAIIQNLKGLLTQKNAQSYHTSHISQENHDAFKPSKEISLEQIIEAHKVQMEACGDLKEEEVSNASSIKVYQGKKSAFEKYKPQCSQLPGWSMFIPQYWSNSGWPIPQIWQN